MKAVYCEKKGPAAKVLLLGELPEPQPGPGEVRVKLKVSGINPTDTKLRGGWDEAARLGAHPVAPPSAAQVFAGPAPLRNAAVRSAWIASAFSSSTSPRPSA